MMQKEIPAFSEKIKEHDYDLLNADKIDILQINVSRRCNMQCKHCHVEAGPQRTEIMSKEILDRLLVILKKSDISTIDITGGSPETNPYLEEFIVEAGKLNKRLVVRSNLTILQDDKYNKFIGIYADNQAEIITSLPCYTDEVADEQRGLGNFSKIIGVIRLLNKKGYAQENSGLILNLVHNPAGPYLPGDQNSLEKDYRRQLKDNCDINFNNLFCMTNIPIGRFLEYLKKSNQYENYMNILVNAFNPCAVDNVMCRSTISVGWDGQLYDCDFNQMLELPVDHGAPDNIKDFDLDKLNGREIVINNHCYGCVAGSGSSCQGATTDG